MHSLLLSLQHHSLFLSTQSGTHCGTGGDLSPEFHCIPVSACLGSATLFLLMVESSRTAGWAVLCLGSPLEFLLNAPSHLAAGGGLTADHLLPLGVCHCNVALLSLLLPCAHGSPGVPLLLACPFLIPEIMTSLFHSDY